MFSKIAKRLGLFSGCWSGKVDKVLEWEKMAEVSGGVVELTLGVGILSDFLWMHLAQWS